MLGPTSQGLLSCTVGGERYALNLSAVVAIERVSELLTEANQGTGMVGLLPAPEPSAEPIPVLRLATLLGVPVGERDTGNGAQTGAILVVASGETRLGLLVDRVERVPQAESGEILALPRFAGERARRMFRGLLLRGDGLEPVLDLRFWVRAPAASPPSPPSHPSHEVPADSAAAGSIDLPPVERGVSRLALFSTSPSGEAPVLFGLSLTQIKEILRPQPRIRLPGAPAHLLGVTLWREQALPIIDLSVRLGGGPSLIEGDSRLLVARGASVTDALAFPVRSELKILPLPIPSRVNAQGRLLDRRLVRGIFELEQGTVFLPDLDHLLAVE